jgi:hypothetical protein
MQRRMQQEANYEANRRAYMKAEGIDLSEPEYQACGSEKPIQRWWGSSEPETNYQAARQLAPKPAAKPYMDPEGAREREIAAEQARKAAGKIGLSMPGALGGAAAELERRRILLEQQAKEIMGR